MDGGTDNHRDAGSFDAVILAGGAGRRMGGADKPAARVGGGTLLGRVARAAADAERLIVVGPPRPEPRGALYVREEPPGGGPVPALRAGLALVRSPWTVLLAADLPFLRPADLARLLAAARASGTGALLLDDGGHEQWLTGAWCTDRLRTALDGYGGGSLKGLLRPLGAVRVTAHAGERPPWFDCDTEYDLRRARDLLGSGIGADGGEGAGGSAPGARQERRSGRAEPGGPAAR